MYWCIGPRYRDRPRADNRHDLRQLAASGRPPGLLAFDGDATVGWCELAPRADLGWLARARHLQPVDDLPVWSLPCFYIRRTHRRRGVMGALIEAALAAAASAGAPALEAYPVDTRPDHTGNLFPGVASAFARHGFQGIEHELVLSLLAGRGRFSLWRGPGADFSERDRGLLTLLRPHLHHS